MMKFSKELLLQQASKTGFRQEILEKVWKLVQLLDGINAHPILKGKFVLKGGTALNLFVFKLPRLSVDIDLNYLGEGDRTKMLQDRSEIEEALEAVCLREDMTIRRKSGKHAGGKWQLRYASVLGQQGNLELDINFMFRVPLWEPRSIRSNVVGGFQTRDISVLNVHELASGKLAALFARSASRDLFDAYQLLTKCSLDIAQLRLGFVLYGAMSSIDWRNVSLDMINFNAEEFRRNLIPVLQLNSQKSARDWNQWGNTLIEKLRVSLYTLLPLKKNEMEFLNRLYDHGKIDPQLLTNDARMINIINSHPLLNWKKQIANMGKTDS